MYTVYYTLSDLKKQEYTFNKSELISCNYIIDLNQLGDICHVLFSDSILLSDVEINFILHFNIWCSNLKEYKKFIHSVSKNNNNVVSFFYNHYNSYFLSNIYSTSFIEIYNGYFLFDDFKIAKVDYCRYNHKDSNINASIRISKEITGIQLGNSYHHELFDKCVQSIKKHNYEETKDLIKYIDYVDYIPNGKDPLYIVAASCGNVSAIKELIYNGFDIPKDIIVYGARYLHFLIYLKENELYNVNELDSHGNNALLAALNIRKEEVFCEVDIEMLPEIMKTVTMLFKDGIDINHENHSGLSPLMKAVLISWTEMIETLIKYGASKSLKILDANVFDFCEGDKVVKSLFLNSKKSLLRLV